MNEQFNQGFKRIESLLEKQSAEPSFGGVVLPQVPDTQDASVDASDLLLIS